MSKQLKSLNHVIQFAIVSTILLAPVSIANATENSISVLPVSNAFQGKLRETAWWRVATERGIDPYILYSVALVESARVSKRLASPYPWSLNQLGKPIIPTSKNKAREILYDSINNGIRSIDVGYMQVNVKWNGHRVSKPDDLLDPVRNIQVGADILSETINSAPGDLALGIGRYHAGWQDSNRAYNYGNRVISVARLIRSLI